MIRNASLTSIVLIWSSVAFGSDSWVEFRGNHGDGVAENCRPPLTWGESRNIRWKTAIHGKGWSSPVVWGDQIWLTTATEDGKKMFAMCVHADSGEIQHDLMVFENPAPRFCHPTNSYASPTPTIEKGRVYVHFGSYGTACLNTRTGKKIWERRDLPCNHWRGPASSPILHEGRLYVAFDGFDIQYMVALDKETGQTVWRKDRNIDYGSDNGDFRKAYGTCTVANVNGQYQLISPSAAETIAYEPSTGDELWRIRHGGMNAATRPLYKHGLVYLTNGDSVGKIKPMLLAMRPGGQLTDQHVVWSMSKGAPKRPSPLIVDELLFAVNDEGVAACLNAKTGETHWQKRLGGAYRASPIFADGRIYFFSMDGKMPVVRASGEFELLATNHLDAGCQASPAVTGNRLIVRTIENLYCIE